MLGGGYWFCGELLADVVDTPPIVSAALVVTGDAAGHVVPLTVVIHHKAVFTTAPWVIVGFVASEVLVAVGLAVVPLPAGCGRRRVNAVAWIAFVQDVVTADPALSTAAEVIVDEGVFGIAVDGDEEGAFRLAGGPGFAPFSSVSCNVGSRFVALAVVGRPASGAFKCRCRFRPLARAALQAAALVWVEDGRGGGVGRGGDDAEEDEGAS
jgi:hypothetical protein